MENAVILEFMNRVIALEQEVKLLKEKIENGDKRIANADAEEVDTSRIGRDTTKYMLDGKKYGKNRMVLAVVHKYVSENKGISASELMTVFDKSLQGSLGVVRTLKDVKKSYSADYDRRFFCKPDEIIHTSTETCVVCTQWGKYNINNILARVKELGIEITVI